MKKIAIIILSILTNGCTSNKCTDKFAAKTVNDQEYLSHSVASNGSDELIYDIVNNPCKWTDSDVLLFWVGSELAYKGNYKSFGKLKFAKPKQGQLIHCHLEIISKKQLFIFEDKSIFYWNDNFSYIYVGYFPTNESTEQIHFFPQMNAVIQ